MVTVFLRKFTRAVYELEGFAKVGKVFVMWCSSITLQPSTCLCKAMSSSPLSGGTPPRQGTLVLAARSDIVGMILALRSQAHLRPQPVEKPIDGGCEVLPKIRTNQ